MIFLGIIKRIVGLWFRKDSRDIKIIPNQNTYTNVTTFELPRRTSGSGVLVGESETQTLTNKTIDAGFNTISGISNTHIAAGAAINPTKLNAVDGLNNEVSISAAELGTLDGVTSNIQTQLNAKESSANKGVANGYASLDGSGKIPTSQLPTSAMEYKGMWNVATNTPVLADGTGDTGDIYIVSTGGTINLGSGSITFAAGDWAVYNGSTWQKSINSNAVSSVNGYTGVVSLTTSDISEGTNLYYTDAKVDSRFVTYKYGTDWTSGTTKMVNHNLGTREVKAVVYEIDSKEEIYVDYIQHTDDNNLTFASSQAPSGSGWRVVISKM